MAVKVIVPSEIYNEVAFGVQFEQGVGIFEDEKYAKEIADTLGYKVEKVEAKKAPAKRKSTKKVEE
ncbi:hypothetical protein ABEU97_20315 [Priestia megaterium]